MEKLSNWFIFLLILEFVCDVNSVTRFFKSPPLKLETIYPDENIRLFSLINHECIPGTSELSREYDWIYDIGGIQRLPCGLGPAGPVYLKSGEVWLYAQPGVIMLNASTFLSLLTGPKEDKDIKKKKETKQIESNGSSDSLDSQPLTPGCLANSSSPECPQNQQTEVKPKKKVPEKNWCLVVNFYSPYCPFSSQLAAGYNALPHVFPRLHVVAVDATESSRLNNRFGIAGTPSVLLWHNGKVIARFEHSDYLFETLKGFISKSLDLDPAPASGIVAADLLGPLPTEPLKFTDYYLILSWLFIVACLTFYSTKTQPVNRVVQYMIKVWREAREANERIAPEEIHTPLEPITESEESADEANSLPASRSSSIGDLAENSESEMRQRKGSQNSQNVENT